MASSQDALAAMATLDPPPAYKAATSPPAFSGVTKNANASNKTQGQAHQGGQQTWKANLSIVNTFTRYEAVLG